MSNPLPSPAKLGTVGDAISDESILELAIHYQSNAPKFLDELINWLKLDASRVTSAPISAEQINKVSRLISIGIILDQSNLSDHAIAVWDYAAGIYSQIDSAEARVDLSKCYGNMAIAYRRRFRFTKAIEYDTKAMQIAQKQNHLIGLLKCIKNISQSYYSIGEYAKVISGCNLTIDFLSKNKKKRQEAEREQFFTDTEVECRLLLGSAYGRLGNYGKALTQFNRLLKLANETKDGRRLEMQCLVNIASIYQMQGNVSKSLPLLGKALDLAILLKDRLTEAVCYETLATIHASLKQYGEALRYSDEAIMICEKLLEEDRGSITVYQVLGKAWMERSQLHLQWGNFSYAMEYAMKAGQIAFMTENTSDQIRALQMLGDSHFYLGSFAKAIAYSEEALKLARKAGDKTDSPLLGSILNQLGTLYAIKNENTGKRAFAKAIAYSEEALKLARKAGDKNLEMVAYGTLGIAYRHLKNFDKAFRFVNRALAIATKSRDKINAAAFYGNLGNMYTDQGNYSEAIRNHMKSLKIAKANDQTYSKSLTYLNLYRAYYGQRDLSSAFESLSKSISLRELMVSYIRTDTDRIDFYGSTADAFQYMVPLCIELGKNDDAFEYADMNKSRALMDLFTYSPVSPERATDERAKLLLARITAASPKDWQRSLPDGTVLIEYFTDEEKTFIFAVTNQTIEARSVNFSRRDRLNHLISCRKALGSGNPGELLPTSLGEKLIEPVADFISAANLVYFVPSGLLYYFPLHALLLNGEPVIRKTPVAYSTSGALLEFYKMKGRGKMQSCSSFGVDFPFEAQQIGQLFGARALTNEEATKNNVIQSMPNKDILHFSCHGLFDELDPLSSGILLHNPMFPKTRDILTAREIFDLKLNADLVTLSACETGVNENRPGDELIGLTRAFLSAGASSVLVSLWRVYNPSTRALMQKFYTELKNGKDKATALQLAQIKIMETKGWEHPHFWAPFVLAGNYK